MKTITISRKYNLQSYESIDLTMGFEKDEHESNLEFINRCKRGFTLLLEELQIFDKKIRWLTHK